MNEMFLTDYKEKLVKQIKMMRPTMDEKMIEKAVKKAMKERFKDHEMDFEGQKTNGLSMIKFINKNRCIIGPYGALFRRHDEAPNQLAAMVDMLLKERKVAKKNKFLHENDEDKTLYKNFDMIQLTLKLLANSFYGASLEGNSIFYHPYFGSSVTAAGRNIIMTAINIFEKFLANHIMLRTIDDIFNYVYNILEEKYEYKDLEVNDKTANEVYIYLCGKLDMPESNEKLENFLIELSQDQLNRIYYKNNLLELIRNSSKLQSLLTNVVAKEDFLDPNSPPEEYNVYLTEIWDILKDWVYYNHLDFYKYENCMERKRQAVLTIDTDSTFCYIQPFVKTCYEVFGIEDSDINRMTTTNVAGWMLGKVIAANYWLMTTNMGIQEDKRTIINMKNEFFYRRIMLTPNRKWYAGQVCMQEGHIKDKPTLDIKGISIKKVTVPKYIRDYFTELIEKDILECKEISLSNIVSKYQKLEDVIKNSIQTGSTEFIKPGKINLIDSYQFPYRIQEVRGVMLWNAIYPNQEIDIPDKVNLVKTVLHTVEDVENSDIPEDIKEVVIHTLKDDEQLTKYGMGVLAIPKNLDKLPDWIIPYIDIDSHIIDNMKPGKIMLDSLGFKDITVGSNQIATNIIDI